MTTTTVPTFPPAHAHVAPAALHERLATVDLLAGCSRRELRIVARHCEDIDVAAGTVLARAGDQPLNVFLVLDGGLHRRSPGGAIRPVPPGSEHGALDLICGQPTEDDLVATIDSSVAVLGARGFKVLLRELPPLNSAMMAWLAGRVRAVERVA
ncbi:MAG: hypothetical protein S0880_26465 [Actinomycetota bacterium]|nr:hypothetical protein [Actinomycetota bacterium]